MKMEEWWVMIRNFTIYFKFLMHTMESNSLSLLNASILENKYRSNSNNLYYSWQNELNNFGEIFSCDKKKINFMNILFSNRRLH